GINTSAIALPIASPGHRRASKRAKSTPTPLLALLVCSQPPGRRRARDFARLLALLAGVWRWRCPGPGLCSFARTGLGRSPTLTFARLLARAGAKAEARGGVCVMIYLLMPTLTPRKPTPRP